MKNNKQEIIKLLNETGKAHHQAFIEVDGDDPEWPIWYADYSFEDLEGLLANEFTKSEYIYTLVLLSKIQKTEAPNVPWAEFYTQYLVNEYS